MHIPIWFKLRYILKLHLDWTEIHLHSAKIHMDIIKIYLIIAKTHLDLTKSYVYGFPYAIIHLDLHHENPIESIWNPT